MADKHQLTDMTIEEISLVDEPANPGAVVEIIKAKFKPCADCEDPEMCKGKGGCSMEKSMDMDEDDEGGNDPDKVKKTKISAASVTEAIAKAIAALTPQIVEKAMAEGFSADEAIADAMAAIIKETVMDLDQVTKALAAAEATIAAHAEVVKAKDAEIASKDAEIVKLRDGKPAAEPSDEEVLKSLPEAIRKRLEDGKAAEVALAKAQEKSEVDGFIAKAKEYGVGDAAVMGPILHRVAKGRTTAEDAKVIEQVLKAAGSVQSHSALFKSLGTSQGDEADPEAVLKSKANDIAKAENISFAKAYEKAMEQNPQLYTDYLAKRRAPAA